MVEELKKIYLSYLLYVKYLMSEYLASFLPLFLPLLAIPAVKMMETCEI